MFFLRPNELALGKAASIASDNCMVRREMFGHPFEDVDFAIAPGPLSVVGRWRESRSRAQRTVKVPCYSLS